MVGFKPSLSGSVGFSAVFPSAVPVGRGRNHTAVKIAPEYAHGVIHVLDASRVVGVVSSAKRRSARTWGRAVMNIFRSAFGNTVVPMSRPSITMFRLWPSCRCRATIACRTSLTALTSLTFSETRICRISSETSSPFSNIREFSASGRKSIRMSANASPMRSASSRPMPFRRKQSVTALYIAPLSMKTKPRSLSSRAKARASVLFPQDEWPSMAITKLI